MRSASSIEIVVKVEATEASKSYCAPESVLYVRRFNLPSATTSSLMDLRPNRESAPEPDFVNVVAEIEPISSAAASFANSIAPDVASSMEGCVVTLHVSPSTMVVTV